MKATLRGLLPLAVAGLLALPAAAQVSTLTAWSLASSTVPGTTAINVAVSSITVAAGTNRLFVVAAVLEAGSAGTVSTFNASFGGVSMLALATTETTSARETVKLWYLLDGQIPAGASTLTVSGTHQQSVTGLHVLRTTFAGVDQTTPTSGSAANYAGGTAVTFGTAVDYLVNGLTFYVTGNGGSPATMTMPAGFTTRLTTTSSAHSSFAADTGTHAAGGTFAAGTSISFGGTTSARSVVGVAALRPVSAPSTTAAGIATASATAGTCNSITVSAPYANDGNANNTLSYRYRTPTGTGAWVGPTARPHSASPYGFAVTPLAAGTYDVEVTYVDADGVTGTATQTVSNIAVGLNCTAAGTVSAVANSCSQVTVSAPYTGDANANGTVAFSRGAAAGGPFTAVTGCAAVGGASPRSCVDTTVAGTSTYYYQAVYSDADGATGTATQVTSAVSTPACVVPNVTTGVPTATVNSCAQITVSAPFTGDTNTNSSTTVERGATATGPWTAICPGLTGASPRSCAASGLTNATPYYFRVSFTETAPDTVQGTNPQVIGPFTTQDCRVLPGVPTASASSCTTVNVSAPFAGDANANGTTTFSRGTSAGGPFTAVCSGVTGASPRTCSDGGRTGSTTYYYEVTFADADGVSGLNPQVTAGATTPACSVNNTTIGTVAATVASCNSVRVTATFTGDGDQDGTATIQWGAGAVPGTWTDACVVSGPSPRQCTVPGLTASTLYSFRALFADADGVVGTNPTTGIQATTTACGGDTVPPTITLLAPSKNAVLAGIETVKVQVWDAVGVSGVLGQVDGTGAAGFTLAFAANANYSCGSGCAVYQYVLPAQTPGPHYFAVRATDTAGNAAVVTIPFRAVAATTGAGNLLRRTSGSQLCIDCHNILTHNAQNTSTKYGSWASDCATCHTPHSTTNIFLVRPQIDTPNSGRKNVDFRTSNGVAANGHATPQASGNGVNVCEVCHTQTKNSDSSPRARNNAATDWTKHYTTACTGCHSHAKGFAAGESEGGVLCKGCHADIWNNMQPTAVKTSRHALAIDSVTDDTVTWGNPLAANVPGARSCLNMCHFDHPHTAGAVVTHENNVYKDATSNASRAATTRDTVTKAKTDFDNAAANGGMCISCHRNPVESGANPAHPAVAQATFNLSAHNYTANALGNWQYGLHDGSTFDRNCTKCHAGSTEKTPSSTAIPFQAVHWSDELSLLAGNTNPAGVAASLVCYNCHGNGTTGANYSNKDLATVFAKTYGHPVNADTTHNSVNEEANAAWGNALGPVARHTNCQDCHEPHAAKAGLNELSQATATYTTGTATFTNASVTVTGQGTTWAAATHATGAWYIRNNTDGRWYRVTAVASATSLTIETAYLGTTAATSAYTLKQRAFTNLAGPALQGGWGAQVTTMPATNWAQTSPAIFTKKSVVSGTDLESTLCFKCHTSYYWGQQNSGTGAGTAAFATTGVVTGTGTNWTRKMVGMSIKSNAAATWHTITAWTSATSLTVTPSPAAAIAAGAYTLATAEQGDPQGTTYVTGTAAWTSGSSTVTGTGTTWNTTTHPGWVIRNNANGKWYTVIAVASATSMTVAPVPDFTAAASAYTLSVPQTDVATEFSTTNAAYHPVLGALPATDPGANGSSQLVAAQLVNGWTPGQTMSCSDCHGNDSVSPAAQGPHGSAVKFTLKGSGGRTNWPTNGATLFVLGGSATQISARATLFCNNCHPDQASTASNSMHRLIGTQTTHSGTFMRCIACHIVLPHGGKVSRLIGTNTAGMQPRYAYQGNQASFFMTMFNKKAKDSYGFGDINRGCTNEHGTNAATGEAW